MGLRLCRTFMGGVRLCCAGVAYADRVSYLDSASDVYADRCSLADLDIHTYVDA